MQHSITGPARRVVATLLIGVCALALSACHPGFVRSIAGTGDAGWEGDSGPATEARFLRPGAIAFDPSGAYFVLDTAACVIRKVDPAGTISTIAGTGTCGNGGMEAGPAAEMMIHPIGGMSNIAIDGAGNVYLADSGNGRIRMVDPSGTMSTVQMKNYGDILPFGSGFTQVAVTSAGVPYVGTTPSGLWRMETDGNWTRVAPAGVAALAADPAGGVVFVDSERGVHRLAEGSTTPVAVTTLPVHIYNIAVDSTGHVYAAGDYHVVRIEPDGTFENVAGNGQPDPDVGIQVGEARVLRLTPIGVAATQNDGLLVSSGRAIYRLQAPSAAPASCDTSHFAPGADLSGEDLTGVDLTGCDLSGTHLEGTDFSGAIMDRVRTGGVTGTPADLPPGWVLSSGWLIGPGADMMTSIDGGDFSEVDFTGVHLTGAQILSVDMTGADLSGAVVAEPLLALVNSNLTGADLSGLNLSTTILGMSTMVGTDIDGTDLGAADLRMVTSSGLIGTPTALPEGWSIVDGSFVPPPD